MKKVLIIDDDRWFAEAIAKSLQTHKWKTQIEENGQTGIDAIDVFKPSVLLVDVMLPDISAPALLNELQSHTDLANLPVVLCTSLETKHFELESLKSYGVFAVLDKSKATPAEIEEALSRAVSKN